MPHVEVPRRGEVLGAREPAEFPDAEEFGLEVGG